MRTSALSHGWPAPIIAIIALVIFWPGVSGPFLLDDGPNLAGMAQFAPVDNFNSLRAYVASVSSGPLGRPLSLASFTLDAQTWPADPASFKRSNILLHAFNGLLLFALVFKLCRISAIDLRRAQFVASLASALWLLHPLQASTVLYVVQRMTELSATFVLLGLLGYIHGRTLLPHAPKSAYGWMSVSLILGTVLATLSKENGALLPFYIVVLELTLLAALAKPVHWRYWAGLFLAIPLMAAPIYVITHWEQINAAYQLRPFTLDERLLTQARIVVTQLVHAIIPPWHTPTLFYDDIQKSTSLLTPFTTIVAVLTLVTLTIAALVLRRRTPYLSFAVLWFLTAHLMESSFIALELFFEHRNYLAFAGPIIALSIYISRLWLRHKTPALLFSALLIIYSATLSYQHATTWGDTQSLSAAWAEEKPQSLDAQLLSTHVLIQEQNYDEAFTKLDTAQHLAPQHLSSQIIWLRLRCLSGTLEHQDPLRVFNTAKQAAFDTGINLSVQRLSQDIRQGRCQQMDVLTLHNLYRHIIENKTLSLRAPLVANIFFDIADYHIEQRQLAPAVRALERAHEAIPKLDFSLRQAAILASASQFEQAQHYLSRAYTLDEGRPKYAPSRAKELDIVQGVIDNALNAHAH